MSRVAAILDAAPTEPCHPWPRRVLTAEQWSELAREPLVLRAAWADTTQVYALYEDPAAASVLPVSVGLDAGYYPALTPHHPSAALFERTIRDLWGHMAAGGDDGAWLDHGHWPHTAPLALRPGPRAPIAEPPEFQLIAADKPMQWGMGPIGPGIAEAGHLRLTLEGTRIVRAESRLGYTHKGALTLMRAKSPRIAARFAARLAGDTTVAHAIAFASATEAAMSVQAPPRATGLRDLMLRLERIAAHLDGLGIVAGLAGGSEAHARCGVRQEYLRRGLAAAFGHRMMMDCVVPGGVAADADANGLSALRQVLLAVRAEVPILRDLFASGALAARLTGLGVTGLGVDSLGVTQTGDAAKRCRSWLSAIDRDTNAAIGLVTDLPEGPTSVALPSDSGEGLGKAVSARGDIWHWLRVDHGQIAAIFPCDPGWVLWPLIEATLIGAEAGDVGLIRASFGPSVSGIDL